MNRTERLIVRLEPAEMDLLKKTARDYGMTVSEFVRVLTFDSESLLTIEEMEIALELCSVGTDCDRLIKFFAKNKAKVPDLTEVKDELQSIRLVTKWLLDMIC